MLGLTYTQQKAQFLSLEDDKEGELAIEKVDEDAPFFDIF